MSSRDGGLCVYGRGHRKVPGGPCWPGGVGKVLGCSRGSRVQSEHGTALARRRDALTTSGWTAATEWSFKAFECVTETRKTPGPRYETEKTWNRAVYMNRRLGSNRSAPRWVEKSASPRRKARESVKRKMISAYTTPTGSTEYSTEYLA